MTPAVRLLKSLMKEKSLGVRAVARGLGVSPSRVHGVLHGERELTADTARRLAKYFHTSIARWKGGPIIQGEMYRFGKPHPTGGGVHSDPPASVEPVRSVKILPAQSARIAASRQGSKETLRFKNAPSTGRPSYWHQKGGPCDHYEGDRAAGILFTRDSSVCVLETRTSKDPGGPYRKATTSTRRRFACKKCFHRFTIVETVPTELAS